MRITKTRIAAVCTALLGVASLASQSAQADADSFPFDAELAAPLGFRARAGLEADIPFVLEHRHYLQPGTRVRVLGVTRAALWAPGAFCEAEYEGHHGYIRCNDPGEVKRVAATSSGAAGGQCGGTVRNGLLHFCNGHDYEECLRVCHCGCDFDVHKWSESDHRAGTTCSRFPQTGAGMIAPDAPELSPLPSFQNIHVEGRDATHHRVVKATQAVIDGLNRLDAQVSAAPWKDKYEVVISTCYRSGIEDTESECGFVFKAEHLFGLPNPTAAQLALANRFKDPYKVGFSSPGASPHSAGFACDIYMADPRTHDALFGAGARNEAGVRAASRALDQAATSAGARRLTYEAWHFQWGGPEAATCTYPGCDRYWPPHADDPGH